MQQQKYLKLLPEVAFGIEINGPQKSFHDVTQNL